MIRRFPSLFLLVLSVFGLFVTDRVRLHWAILLMTGIILFLVALFLMSQNRKLFATVCLGLAFAALVSFQFSLRYIHPGSNHVSRVVDSRGSYRIYGKVSDWPLLRLDRTEIKISLDSLSSADGPARRVRGVSGAILLKISDTTTMLQRGDRVSFRGRIYLATERSDWDGFDYNRYLNLQGIFGVCYLPTALAVTVDHRPEIGFYSLIDKMRKSIVDTFNDNLSALPAALAGGFLIGETRNIPPEIYEMFRDSGTLHVLAVSGSNVALVLLFMLFVLRPFRLTPLKRTIVLAVVIVIFNGLSYGDPSILRASVMATLILIARLAGRKFDLNNVIALTALIILVADPAQLFDVGFQLSFVTAWGLIFFMPMIAQPFEKHHNRLWYRWLIFPIAAVVVAQVCSMPLIAYYFNKVPIISPLANLIIIPLVSLSLFGILAMLAAAIVHPFLGQVVGALLELLMNLTISLLRWFGGPEAPILTVSPGLADRFGVVMIVVFYLLILTLALSVTRVRLRKFALIGVLLLIQFPLVLTLASPDETDRSISFHRLPGGIAAIVRLGEGKADLILTGLTSRTYPLDQQIIEPLLSREEITSLDQLFVMNADFLALDDIGRLARSTQANQLWLSSDLRSAATDQRLNGLIDSLAPHYFGSRQGQLPSEGYLATRDYIILRRGEQVVVILPQVHQTDDLPDLSGPTALLAIGGRLPNQPELWLKLRSAGYSKIVCATVEQSADFTEEDPAIDPNLIPPDFVNDLSQVGSVSFQH